MLIAMLHNQDHYNRQIAFWLLFCAGVIFAMILLGGVTRLTNSGLSMVEWRPLIGIIPPLNEIQWQEVFNQYQQFPEYQKINHSMDLVAFKSIFMFEYLHRVLGRLIGVIFLLPFLFFYFKKRIPSGLTPRLSFMFVLGGLQGALGWYMVKSGLVDNPDVSQYRLTAHLGAAVIIYGYILWTALGLLMRSTNNQSILRCNTNQASCLKSTSFILSALVFIMILSGGFVAGTNAGFAYPTFPLMGDSFIPDGLYQTDPSWLAAFEDITTIQFNHRIFAYFLVLLIATFSYKVLMRQPSTKLRIGIYYLLAALVIQICLGVTTLLTHVYVPIAASHQGGAILLFTASLFVSSCFKQCR